MVIGHASGKLIGRTQDGDPIWQTDLAPVPKPEREPSEALIQCCQGCEGGAAECMCENCDCANLDDGPEVETVQ